MKAIDVIGYIQDLEYENARMKDDISALREKCFDATRFDAISINIEMVARLHNIHPDTVRKYVKLGLIDKHPDSVNSKILIRASDALILDFRKFKSSYKNRQPK